MNKANKPYSKEEIIAMAALERKMDSGEQPFVVCNGKRWPFSRQIFEEYKLVSGQTASETLLAALIKANLRLIVKNLSDKIAIKENEWPDELVLSDKV